jgi:hypothetical protein
LRLIIIWQRQKSICPLPIAYCRLPIAYAPSFAYATAGKNCRLVRVPLAKPLATHGQALANANCPAFSLTTVLAAYGCICILLVACSLKLEA